MKRLLRNKFLQDQVRGWDYVVAFFLAAFASGIVYGLEHLTVEKFSNISSVLILAVLISAILLGKGPAIMTAVVCSFLYDWLMVPPFFGTINSADNLIKFTVFVTAALLTSWIASMAKSFAIQLKWRERELMGVINEREQYKKEKEEEAVKREAESLRNAILASVSHDLKTPLASIIGAMSSLKLYGQTLPEEDKVKLANSVLSEANRLLGYVNNLLEVAKLEDKYTIMKRETVAIDDILDLTIKRLTSRLRQHKMDIRQGDATLAFLGDERLIDIALGNVLDNAVKFSPEGSTITISAVRKPEKQQIMVQVEDEGIGIPERETELVFDKFYRAKQTDQKNMGTGLGLWIARRIIEAHGGTIRLTSREKKKGTRVVITLRAATLKVLPLNEMAEAV